MIISKNKLNHNLKKLITSFYKPYSKAINNNGLRILAYHSITNKKTNLWNLKEDIFLSHANFFKNHLDVHKSEDLINNIPSKGIVLTFDDGYKDNFEYVAPILFKLKIPFTIFVITDHIKNCETGFLNEKELKEIAKNPLVTIGSHSKTHARLAECDKKELNKEIFHSKHYLEDLLGQPIKLFSYPHGSYNSYVIENLKEANYKLAFSSHFDIVKPEDNKYYLNRNEIWNTDDIECLKEKLDGNWDWLKYRNFSREKNL